MRQLHKLLLLIPILFVSVFANAQTRTVTGKVLSDNKPVVNASVTVKDKSIGTTTSNDGSFTLNVPTGNVRLVVSYVGFNEREISVANNETNISVDLTPSSQQLNEVVVTALGVTKNKRTLNYSTQTVETKDLTKARETNVANSLSGKVAGLDVVRSSQGVGSNVRIVLRGDRSINNPAQSQALIIIDGVPGDIGTLNPDDIASMNVLKDSYASELY